MKITQIIISVIFTFLVFDSNAQEVREMQPLSIQDFKCLQSLECAQNSQSLKSKGWVFVFDETVDEYTRELTAKMKGEKVYFFAIYDEQGIVIRSKYKLENTALPSCILRYLAENNDMGWRIAGTKMEVKDFEPFSIKYIVMLENGTSNKSEVYNFEFINDLHFKYKELAESCFL